MTRPPPCAAGMLLLLLAAAALAGPLPEKTTGRLSESALRGKEVYTKGASASGDGIIAQMGEGTEVPATVLPCSSCHGADGRGNPEGGVIPTNITWEALTKPYGVRRSRGRSDDPPYDRPLLTRAIAMGIDSGGSRLSPAMPRYRMTREEMNDLLSYLQAIESDRDPGLTPDRITIGTLLPGRGPHAARAAAMEQVLRAYFADLNEQGGIYGRRLELRVGASDKGPDATAAFRRFLEQEEPFALTAVFMAGDEQAITELVREAEVPLIGALAVDPREDAVGNPHVFYLDSGLEGQARALIEFAAGERVAARPSLAILHRVGTPLGHIVEAVEDQARASSWPDVRKVPVSAHGFDPAKLTADLRGSGAGVLLLLACGAPEKALLQEASRVGWHPRVLIPGLLAGAEVFDLAASAEGGVFLAFSRLATDKRPEGLRGYDRLAARHGLPAEFPAAQLTTLASATILVEGLKRAGSGLSRERLLAVLENLRDFDTHLAPPVSFGPNRRVGLRGARIVSIDLRGRAFVPAGERD